MSFKNYLSQLCFLLFHLDGSEHRVVDDVHVVGVDAFGNQCGTLDVFDFFHTLYLGEDEVGIACLLYTSDAADEYACV